MTVAKSLLLHPVAIDGPIPDHLPDVLDAELRAWIGDHRPPHTLAELDRLVIAERHLLIRYQGDRGLGAWVTELRSQPSAPMLAGLVAAEVLLCAAVLNHTDDTERWRCNVQVDVQGRHAGPHLDGRFGDEAEWPNGNPVTPPPALTRADDPTAPFLPASMVEGAAEPTAELVPAGAASRRRGIYLISDDDIVRAMRMPPGQHVLSMTTDFQRMAILVQVEGDDLEEVAVGCHAPTINGADLWHCRPTAAMLAGLPPPQRHAAILAAVEATVLEDAAALQGRLRILRRHEPVERTKFPEEPHFCAACIERPHYAGESAADWPCADYADAAGDLIETDTTGDHR